MRGLWVMGLAAALLTTACLGAEKPYWLAPVRRVAAEFDGTRGHVAQLGDSITYSMAPPRARPMSTATRT